MKAQYISSMSRSRKICGAIWLVAGLLTIPLTYIIKVSRTLTIYVSKSAADLSSLLKRHFWQQQLVPPGQLFVTFVTSLTIVCEREVEKKG